MNETMYRVLLALRSSDQQAADILDGLRHAGSEIPSLAAFYRSLKSGLTEGWLEIAGSDASGPGRPRQIYTLTSFGRRALDKPTYPGELDNMIAGGQPVGIGLMENVIKEAAEEAAVPAALAATAVAVGAISYCQETADGLKPDVMFTYDLELPADFVPHNTDGEIAEFMLLPAREVMEITEHTSDFKLNCALVNMDFCIRHGLLAPDHPDYVAIVRGLHR